MKQRSFSQKDEFMDGNRQKWAGIFVTMAAVVMLCQILFKIDPNPYLTLLTFIGSFLIGGDTLTEFVKTKAFESKSASTSHYSKEEVVIKVDVDITENVIEQTVGDAPIIKPFTQAQDIGENFETTSDLKDTKNETISRKEKK